MRVPLEVLRHTGRSSTLNVGIQITVQFCTVRVSGPSVATKASNHDGTCVRAGEVRARRVLDSGRWTDLDGSGGNLIMVIKHDDNPNKNG